MIFIRNDYKTIQFAVYFTDADNEKTRVHRFLLPKLLSSHTIQLASRISMNQKLEDLYGAYFSTRVEQLGNLSVISIVFTIVEPNIVEDENLLDQAILLLKDVLFRDDQFSKEIFNEE
ncbi:MAG: hypothetical protein Q7I99_06685, partial [Acholeplasmataceae bacterium]|nr:hypothetical protein [Acholeplasmataceae bacterium]